VTTLSVELLGTPRVTVDSQSISVDTRKAIALLAYLTTTNHPVARDTLAALLWPEYDQDRARASLRRTLSALRRGLGPFADWLQSKRGDVGLSRAQQADVQVDVDRFTAFLATIETHSHGPEDVCEACLQPLTEAVALHRGDFLAGFSLRDCAEFEEWQQFQTDSFRRQLAAALERLARLASRLGKHTEAIAAARRRLSLDVLHEPAQRQLMLAYAWAGERAAALEQYRRCVRTLDDELGVAPLPETTRLAELIRENRTLPPLGVGAAQHPVTSDPTPLFAEQGAPLVGRATELRELHDAYESTISHGCLVVLEGEAGIGKTRLAETFLAQVRALGSLVIAARSYEGESDLAYGVIVEAVHTALRDPGAAERLQLVPDHWLAEAARLLPDLTRLRPALPPPLADQTGTGARLVEGLRKVLFQLARGPKPAVLFMDDLQWADEATLELVAHLIRHFGDQPLVLLVTWRDEDGPTSGRLRRIVADARRSGTVKRLALARLAPEQVAELVARHVGDPERAAELAATLYEQTEGLPLFLTAHLEALADRATLPDVMPASMRDLLRARVTNLSEAAQQLLGTAAIIGHSFNFATLRDASGRTDAETVSGLEELLARRMVREVDTEAVSSSLLRFDFTHEQLRQVVYRDMSLVRRRLLHRRVAEVLRGVSGGTPQADAEAGQIAQHYRLAGQDDLAAEYYQQAGERAQRLHANAEALGHFEAALALGHAEPARLHEAMGDLLMLKGTYDAAATSYELAAARAPSTRLVVIERKLGSLFVRQGAWERAESHFQTALSTEVELDPAERVRLLTAWSLAAHRQGELDFAWALARQALDTATAAKDPRGLAECHNILGMLARHRSDLDQAASHLESSLQLATASADPTARLATLNNLALLCAANGEPERGLELIASALEVCRLLGDRHQEAALLTNAADLLRATGRTNEAVEHVRAAVAILADIGAELSSLQPEIWKLTEW
jgi:predicted ATPase/DNA-binding SARP family transcriptional activator